MKIAEKRDVTQKLFVGCYDELVSASNSRL